MMKQRIKQAAKYINQRQQGFTLVELMVVVAILAVLTSIAIPSFRSSMARNAVVAEANRMTATLNYMRATAISTRSVVTAVSISGVNWADGWTACVDADNGGDCGDANDVVLRTEEPSGGAGQLTFNGVADIISFTGAGTVTRGVGRYTTCDPQAQMPGRMIEVSAVGRVNVIEVAAAACLGMNLGI